MIETDLLDKFNSQFDNLKIVVSQSSIRIVTEPADMLFYDNQNVFIKSYLVSACSMLEAYIQDLIQQYVDTIQSRINLANLPYNFVVWLADHDKAKLNFSSFKGSKTKKDVSDLVSPNFYRTIKAFERVGVDVSSEEINAFKDYVSSIVEKRNRIVHHNDDASDISFSDVIAVIDEFKKYCCCLHEAVCKNVHLASQ